VENDLDQAIALFRAAAAQGFAPGQQNLDYALSKQVDWQESMSTTDMISLHKSAEIPLSSRH